MLKASGPVILSALLLQTLFRKLGSGRRCPSYSGAESGKGKEENGSVGRHQTTHGPSWGISPDCFRENQ